MYVLCLTLKCQVLLSSLRSVEALGEDAKGVPLPSDSNGVSTNSASLNTTSASSAGDRRSMHTEMLEQLLLAPVQERDGRELEGRLARPPTSPPLPYQRAPTSPLSVAASSGHFSATPSPGSELLARLRLEVDLLREERQAASERWARERRALERQLLEARDGGREAERRRSVEEQLRDILTVVRSLNSMVSMTHFSWLLYHLQRKRETHFCSGYKRGGSGQDGGGGGGAGLRSRVGRGRRLPLPRPALQQHEGVREACRRSDAGEGPQGL